MGTGGLQQRPQWGRHRRVRGARDAELGKVGCDLLWSWPWSSESRRRQCALQAQLRACKPASPGAAPRCSGLQAAALGSLPSSSMARVTWRGTVTVRRSPDACRPGPGLPRTCGVCASQAAAGVLPRGGSRSGIATGPAQSWEALQTPRPPEPTSPSSPRTGRMHQAAFLRVLSGLPAEFWTV